MARPWPSRTRRNASDGCLSTGRSITRSGSTRPWTVAQLSSGSLSCSADEAGETQQPEAFLALELTPKRTRPSAPRTNGKDEQLIKTLQPEWVYSMDYKTSSERNCCLPRYLAFYNSNKFHMARAGRTPIEQLGFLRTTE